MPIIWGTDAGETLAGGADNDEVYGGGGDDSVAGLDGADTLSGGAGNDTLDGGAGVDNLSDGNGSGRLIGGPGFDFIAITWSSLTQGDAAFIDAGEDGAYIRLSLSTGWATATVLGSAAADQIYHSGNIGGVIDAGGGADLVVVTDPFSNNPYRHAARQTVTVTLGSGADQLRYNYSEAGLTLTVTDFQPGNTGDRLLFDIGSRILGWDGQTNPFSAGYVRLIQSGADVVLQLDGDAGGTVSSFLDILRFKNVSASAFTAFNMFDYAPNGAPPAGSAIVGTETHDDLRGTVGADSIVGLGGLDELLGLGGSDTLDGGADMDALHGGTGDDSLVGGAGNDDLTGDDNVDSSGGADTLIGGDGRDFLNGGIANDRLFGDAGVDQMYGGKGDDWLSGGDDGDRLSGEEGSDTLEGGDGDDWLEGGSGADTLAGGGGGDTFAQIGFHTAFTEADIDVITDWSPFDTLRYLTNTGSDTGGAYVEITAADLFAALAEANRLIAARTAVYVAAQIGADVMVFAYAAQFGAQATEGTLLKNRSLADISVANVYGATVTSTPGEPGTPGNDNAALSEGADSYSAGAGDDTVSGLGGNDQITGGAGNDQVLAGPGNDSVSDLSGSNYLRGDEGNDVIEGGSGFDDINGNIGSDIAWGGLGDDWVVGGKDNDALYGQSGNDIVYGNLGNDTCDGGDGDDVVRGGQQDDVINGGAGNDYMSGDRDSDTVTGGAGADLFHTFGEAGLDRVTDFNLAEGDRVMLDPGTSYTLAQIGADTVIDMVGGGQMVLVGVQLSTLTPGWIFGA